MGLKGTLVTIGILIGVGLGGYFIVKKYFPNFLTTIAGIPGGISDWFAGISDWFSGVTAEIPTYTPGGTYSSIIGEAGLVGGLDVAKAELGLAETSGGFVEEVVPPSGGEEYYRIPPELFRMISLRASQIGWCAAYREAGYEMGSCQ